MRSYGSDPSWRRAWSGGLRTRRPTPPRVQRRRRCRSSTDAVARRGARASPMGRSARKRDRPRPTRPRIARPPRRAGRRARARRKCSGAVRRWTPERSLEKRICRPRARNAEKNGQGSRDRRAMEKSEGAEWKDPRAYGRRSREPRTDPTGSLRWMHRRPTPHAPEDPHPRRVKRPYVASSDALEWPQLDPVTRTGEVRR